MGWALAGDWLAVAGLTVLTFGTGVQAWANLGEYKAMRQVVSKATRDAIGEARSNTSTLTVFPFLRAPLRAIARRVPWLDPDEYLASIDHAFDLFPEMQSGLSIWGFLLIFLPGKLAEIRALGQNEAVELARFLRLAGIWGILMFGSALALAAAVIQLALA
jgi:hypothetical protein